MKVKCIDNQNVEDFLTKGKVYEVIESDYIVDFFAVVDDVSRVYCYHKRRFGVVPSIDDVIKDKEKEERTMNGLEAIELMKQGKIVESDDYFPHFIDSTTGKMMILVNKDETAPAINFDINYEGYREYIEPKPVTGWERNMENDIYTITSGGEVEDVPDTNSDYDNRVYEVANYFSTREKAEEINFKQTLFRKLQRFSDENGGNEIDWSDDNKRKFFIFYCSVSKELDFYWNYTDKHFGQVYFISEEVVKQAIELFHDDLIKYFTHDWSEGNE